MALGTSNVACRIKEITNAMSFIFTLMSPGPMSRVDFNKILR